MNNKIIDNKVANLYTEQKDKYAAFANESFSWKFIEKPLLEKELSKFFNSKSKILDAGCGVGRTLEFLLQKGCSPKNIIGVDINKDMLEVSKNKAPNVKHVKADIEKIKLPEDSFDLILSTHVFHYFDDQKLFKTLINLFKLLKPNGVLFFVITHPVRTARHDLSQYFDRRWIVDHTPWGTESPLCYRPVSDYINTTIRAGFTLDSFIEPDVIIEGKKFNNQDYEKYHACPSRIAIKAVKL